MVPVGRVERTTLYNASSLDGAVHILHHTSDSDDLASVPDSKLKLLVKKKLTRLSVLSQ